MNVTLRPGEAAPREFLMARAARDRYRFSEPLFTLRGESVTGDLYAARVLAWRMNKRRDLTRYPELAVKAGRLYTMGLIEEILHYLIRRYVQELAPGVFATALAELGDLHQEGAVEETLRLFTGHFPPGAVYREGLDPAEYLRGSTAGTAHREIALEELILLTLANRNRAYAPYRELFDDIPLKPGTLYEGLYDFFERFFRSRPPFGPGGQSLLDVLRAPALASPDSLEGQLDFILRNWSAWIAPFMSHLLTGLDLLREEDKPAFAGFGGMTAVPDWQVEAAGEGHEREDERYSLDRDWMSRVVLLAKSAYVWLHQLSAQYGREIARLDQVPDEELDRLARWGFTSLWLIGVWERSAASKEIKRRCGNPEAESSAYSLYDYAIAQDLGGQAALENLKERAWRRGVRLAADMVPNHTGIYSRWVVEHPDWYVQLPHPPFPAYRFTGPNLSPDPAIEIRLEDGYWSRTDAAVVFQRTDRGSGEVRYIYHGNDGTGLPWNDTAQLNYLKPEVREAVLGTIMHVAGLFPIIRFDAAMTLSKRHYRRLWFPAPGSGGDIPSRAGQGMPTAEFHRLFPQEFWREVVDRAAREAPDALLLAEAFWLMEGYFVRTLGMHRVYNSAFMNMLKREANAEYRQTLKNVLEYDPEILKRFVNFMNNPDEETAVAQFGKDDKYFGTAVLLATLPGLPMVGHGQVEGFTEKYGMEYRRSYWDETVDEGMVARHEREIFPLFRRRHLFADVEHFTLYDLYRPEGGVDENVYAYSNRHGGERSLVIYHNVYANTAGWIRDSAAMLQRTPHGRTLARRTLGEELGLDPGPGMYCLFRDVVHDLEYLRPCRELAEQGLQVILEAFQYHVFLDFRQVRDTTGAWGELHRLLDGRGVASLERALRELILTPLHQAFRELFSAEGLRLLAAGRRGDRQGNEAFAEGWRRWAELLPSFLARCREALPAALRREHLEASILQDTALVMELPLGEAGPLSDPAASLVPAEPGDDLTVWRLLLAWNTLRRLGELAGGGPDPERSAALLDEWLLGREVERTFRELGCSEETAGREVLLLRLLVRYPDRLCPVGEEELEAGPDMAARLEEFLQDPEVQRFLGVNRYRDIVWFVRERFEELVAWLHLTTCLHVLAQTGLPPRERERCLARGADLAGRLIQAAERAGYRVDLLLREAGGAVDD